MTSIKALTLANAVWKPTQSSPIEAKTLTKKTVMLVSAMTVFPTIAAASIALCTQFFRFKMQGGKIICKRFSTANPFNATIGSKQQLLRTQLTIVIKAHRLTVCASVLNNQQVTINDRWQRALDSKLIVVFTERTHYIDDLIVSAGGFTKHINMVISVVHAGTH